MTNILWCTLTVIAIAPLSYLGAITIYRAAQKMDD